MKKIISPILVFVTLIGSTQIVYAAKPDQPWLLTPLSASSQSTTAPVIFSWANLPSAVVTNYRLVVSTTSDFSSYNQKTNACISKLSCFTVTQQKTTYSLPNTNAIFKADANYFWRVEAINNDGVSVYDVRTFAFGTAAPVITDPKFAAVVMPNITAVTSDISSVEQGKPIKISATLDTALPTGYTVKINYGNGLVAMTSSATGFDYTATPSKSAAYAIGIYDAKNVLKSNKMTGKFEVTAPILANVPPVLSLISKAATISKIETNKVYTAQLSAKDGNGNLSLIFIDWGDGSTDSITVSDSQTLSLTHIYTTAGTLTWTATAYDYSDVASNIITQAVTVSAPVVAVAPVVTTPATGTTSTTSTTTVTPITPNYTRIAIDGSENPTRMEIWGCTRDTKSNLIWEIKTNDGGLHDKNWTYSWYDPDKSKNGSNPGLENGGICKGSKCNTYDFINVVNKNKLCGAEDWRLPTKTELEGLVICSDGKSTTFLANQSSDICTGSPTSPTITKDYFPNTPSSWFWTSATFVQTPSAVAKPTKNPKIYADSAWSVDFYYGSSHAEHKGNSIGVRLVSGGTKATTTGTTTTGTTTGTTTKP